MIPIWRTRFVKKFFVLCTRPLVKLLSLISCYFSYFVVEGVALMARNRKQNPPSLSHKDSQDRRVAKGSKTSQAKRVRRQSETAQVGWVFLFVLGAPLLLTGGYVFWTYRRASRLLTPIDAPPVVNRNEADASRFWGTYRSNLYFGLR